MNFEMLAFLLGSFKLNMGKKTTENGYHYTSMLQHQGESYIGEFPLVCFDRLLYCLTVCFTWKESSMECLVYILWGYQNMCKFPLLSSLLVFNFVLHFFLLCLPTHIVVEVLSKYWQYQWQIILIYWLFRLSFNNK